MRSGLDPFQFLLFSMAGWMNQRQQHAVDYLLEENRVLRMAQENRTWGYRRLAVSRTGSKASDRFLFIIPMIFMTANILFPIGVSQMAC